MAAAGTDPAGAGTDAAGAGTDADAVLNKLILICILTHSHWPNENELF